jgi:ElaB/YqjD/DUF883 family membrane-anchored ribosome-binding protein
MAADLVVSRELKSLQDELSAVQRERLAAPIAPDTPPPTPAEQSKQSSQERELRDQLRELANELTSFFEEADKTISAHPTQSVIGAMLVGILIGYLLGRR